VLALGDMRQGVAHPMHPTPLPRGAEHTGDGMTQAVVRVRDHQLDALFGRIKIWRDEDGDVLGAVTRPAGRYNCFSMSIICMAGPVAALKLTGVPLEQQPGSYTDVTMAREALAKVDFGGDLDLHSILPFCHLLVDHEWPWIQFLACHLLDRKRLDYDEVVRLIEQAADTGAARPGMTHGIACGRGGGNPARSNPAR
jgi:hypothetical protein